MARLHSRSEIYVAVAVGVGIVVVTALLVWAMRPARAGIPGTGGLFTRQPRVCLWLLLVGVALFAGLWWALRSDRTRRRLSTRNAVLVVVGAVAVGAVLAAVFWPGGLVKEYKATPSAELPTDLPTPEDVAPDGALPDGVAPDGVAPEGAPPDAAGTDTGSAPGAEGGTPSP